MILLRQVLDSACSKMGLVVSAAVSAGPAVLHDLEIPYAVLQDMKRRKKEQRRLALKARRQRSTENAEERNVGSRTAALQVSKVATFFKLFYCQFVQIYITITAASSDPISNTGKNPLSNNLLLQAIHSKER